MQNPLICASHTISGVMPGHPEPARHSFGARAEACALAGYTGICLHLRDYAVLRASGRSDGDLRAILAANGLVNNSMEFLLGWDDGAESSAGMEKLAWEAANGLGLDVLNTGSGAGGTCIDPDRERDHFVALCARAQENGVSIALEVVPWSRTPDLASATGLIAGIPNAGLVIDCWHIFRGGIPLAQVAALDGNSILSVQINDALADPGPDLFADTFRRLPCGEGVFDLDGFLVAIRRTGTLAPIAVEVISPELAAKDVREAAKSTADSARVLLARTADTLPQGVSPYG